MMNDKSVLCNETFEPQINVGVARHSIVGTTVYGATLRNHVKKIKHRGGYKAMAVMPKYCQEETRENYDNTTGLCFFILRIEIITGKVVRYWYTVLFVSTNALYCKGSSKPTINPWRHILTVRMVVPCGYMLSSCVGFAMWYSTAHAYQR